MEKWFQILKSKSFCIVIALILLFPNAMVAQESTPNNWSVNGYVTNMQSFTFQNVNDDWMSENLLHNRLNIHWTSNSGVLAFKAEFRNRLLSGDLIKYIPNYLASTTSDKGWLNLSINWAKGNSYVLTSKIDRAYLDINLDKVQLRIGRQRINWGQCTVWNPNDLFNTYSFFDVDYIERPGSDAIRVQYYTGNTSSMELAIKADMNNRITAAGLYKFNALGYDFQLLGGIMNSNDYVLGAGWSGSILNAAFTGECSYFHPKTNFSDTTGVFTASLGGNYSFSNSFSLQTEILYNETSIADFSDFYNLDMSAKSLSFSKFTVLLQASYPITPLLNLSIAGMYYPDMNGSFVGPTLSYSLTENLECSLLAQSFSGKFASNTVQNFNFAFLKMKLNF